MKDDGKVKGFYLVNGLIRFPYYQTIDEEGIISEGKHLFNSTYNDAYKIARKRAKKYCKAKPGRCFRFYYMTDADPQRLSMFTYYGSFYRDSLKPFVRQYIGYIRYGLSRMRRQEEFIYEQKKEIR